MTCENVREQLPAWLDGEVDAEQGVDLAAHLRGCSSCTAEAGAYRHLQEGLDVLVAPKATSLEAREQAFADLRARLSLDEQAAQAGQTGNDRRIPWSASQRSRDRSPSHATSSATSRRPGNVSRVSRSVPRWLGFAGTALAAAIALTVYLETAKGTTARRSAVDPVEVELVDAAKVSKTNPVKKNHAESSIAQVNTTPDPPDDLRKRAAMFVDYPIVVHLDELQKLESVLAQPDNAEGRG